MIDEKLENKKVIWITGASSGLGRALAIEYASSAHFLILSGRNTSNLELTGKICIEKGADYIILPFDICKKNEVLEALNRVSSEIGKVDILINNSGIGQRSSAIDTKTEVEEYIFSTNYWGHVWLTKGVLPLMKNENHGQIIVISSLSGMFGFPLRSTYAASKHALNGYFETLAIEVKAQNIHITIVCPGRLQNDFSQHALKHDGSLYGKTDKAHIIAYPLSKAAKIIIRASAKHQFMLVLGGKEKILWYLKRLSPTLFFKLTCKLDPQK
jgi:short-subunit dehydrogenase